MAQKTEEARLLRETLMALEAFSADSLSLSEVEVNNITARSGKLPKVEHRFTWTWMLCHENRQLADQS